MKILKFPHPSLFTVCKPVTVFGAEIKTLLDLMWQTMRTTTGVGLAANQVGLEYRMFVMEVDESRKLYVLNPRIVSKSIVITLLKEGCLSAPGELLATGSRAEWVEVEYQDEKGNVKRQVFKGLYSVCVQHEIDHLDGKAFMEAPTISKAKRKELAKKWGLKIK